jgi:tetratricopeptide (TPR) repeat protein
LKGGLEQKSQIDAGILYELHYHLGIAYRKKGFGKLAERHYRDAIATAVLPQLKLGACNNLGNLLKAKGDLAGAKTAYETAVNIDPNFGLGHNNLGMVLRAMGNSRGAIASYRRAIALNPDYAEAYQNLGAALLAIGNLPDSLDAFGKAIALYEKTDPAEGARLRRNCSEMGWQI